MTAFFQPAFLKATFSFPSFQPAFLKATFSFQTGFSKSHHFYKRESHHIMLEQLSDL